MCTCPASVALLRRSCCRRRGSQCAMCAYAMIQLSLPMVVTPFSCTVPRLSVQPSRIVLRIADHEPRLLALYFLSWGSPPIDANE
jgi:hypothetical protein